MLKLPKAYEAHSAHKQPCKWHGFTAAAASTHALENKFQVFLIELISKEWLRDTQTEVSEILLLYEDVYSSFGHMLGLATLTPCGCNM